MMRTICSVTFTRRTGKIVKCLEAESEGLLKLWALQNTTKTRDTILFYKDTGEVLFYVEGAESFPQVHTDVAGENIEDYCVGMLAAVNT